MKRKIVAFFILALIIFQITASAESPYKTYTYDNLGDPVASPDAVYLDKSIDTDNITNAQGKKVGRLNTPSDLFVDKENHIYIADSGNNRIVVLNGDYTFNNIISNFINMNGKASSFANPTGIFVDSELNIYIADQGNGRIVELDKTGKLKRVITLTQAESKILPDGFTFQPAKLTVDSAGRIFVVSTQFNMGLIELDKYGKFVQTLGAPKVTFDPVAYLWRLFSTRKQIEGSIRFTPTEFNNINIDKEDFVYVTTDVVDASNYKNVGSVKKVNALGSDVLKANGNIKPYGDEFFNNAGTYAGPSRLRDVMTLNYGMYAVLDGLRCRIFFYNNEGQLLFEFGSPADTSDVAHADYTNNCFDQPTAIAWLNGSCLVLDKSLLKLSVYTLTDYGKKIMKATELHYNDKYNEEAQVWNEILKINNNNFSARQSLGKVAYRNEQYTEAMKYFKQSDDKENYSKAFKFARRDSISKNFSLGLIILVLAIALIAVGVKLRKKYLPPITEGTYLGHLMYAKRVIFRPINSYWSLIRENNSSVASATTILLGAGLMSLLQARFTGYIFLTQTPESINLVLEFMKIISPVLLFCVCNWCVTSLLNGEGNLRAIYIGTSYALTPIILLYPVAIVLSNIMVKQEGDFYTVFVTIALLWVMLLLFLGNMRLHDYTLGQEIGVMVLTAVVMLIIVFLGTLFFALMQQVIGFINDISNELTMRS